MAQTKTSPASSLSVDARILRTRAALSRALFALLEHRPYDQITIREIAKEADIGYATFFRHYPSKEALLHDIAADQITELLELAFPILNSTDSYAAALALCRYVADRRVIWSALLTGGAAGMMREEFIRQAKSLGSQQIQAVSWLPDDLAVIYGVTATVEILAWWLQQGEGYTIEKVAEILDRLVISPTFAGQAQTA